MSGIHQAPAQRGERARIALGAIRRDDDLHEPFFLGLVLAPDTTFWNEVAAAPRVHDADLFATASSSLWRQGAFWFDRTKLSKASDSWPGNSRRGPLRIDLTVHRMAQ